MRLRLSHEGEGGNNGGPAGDLYVAVSVKPHPIFTRQDTDIVCDVPVSFVTAALGGKVAVPTLTGETIIKVPPGTHHDKLLRLKGLGVRHAGDQIIRIKIEIPTKLTARQKEILSEFAKESGMTLDKDGDGFFEKMKNYFE